MAKPIVSARNTRLPLRVRKRKISYRETFSDSEGNDESYEPIPSTHARRSSSRQHRRAHNHDTPESGAESRSEAFSSRLARSPGAARAWVMQKQDSRCLRTKTNPGATQRPAVYSRSKRKSLGAKLSGNQDKGTQAKKEITTLDVDDLRLGGRVPPWHTLPYEILLQIFQYASYPLVTELFQPSASLTSGWLLKLALSCRGFAEPALSALYYAPPLCPPSRAHKLLSSLAEQNEQSTFNYRAKVKYLDVEAEQVLRHKYNGQEPIDLGILLSYVPQVRGVRIYLLSDHPVWHKRAALLPKSSGKRWAYQASLFDTLAHRTLHLRRWTWNATLLQHYSCQTNPYIDYHEWTAFQSLRSLTLVNAVKPYDITELACSTNVLSQLSTVRFQNVVIKDTRSLIPLPRSLEVLEFTNCASLNSGSLARLLNSHGGKLKELVLNHNDALDLSYLQDLAYSCPKLEELKMDLRFYNSHVTYSNSEPKFKTLLEDADRPTWPRTLRHVEMFHLRKWDTSAAQTFFASLIDSAKELPDLRHIDIKASLGESNWRDRIGFRDKWTKRMEKVFRRVAAPPDFRLQSIATFNTHKREFRRRDTSAGIDNRLGREPGYQFNHVQIASSHNPSTDDDSDTPLSAKRRSTRLKTRPNTSAKACPPGPHRPPPRKPRKRKRATQDSSSEEDSALEDLHNSDHYSPSHALEDDDDADLFVQGMCDTVRVVIDNLRPTEEHLDESYFLDEEKSGDEDWTGDGDFAQSGGEGYAW
ncbi:MAG: hypothetical protein Q9219_000619 [cf. Caloplaca sp. 3 TL-2023]